MKIIKADNFDRDTESDYLVCDNVGEYYGNLIVDLLNANNKNEENYFRLVSRDYKLKVWEP